jgi:anti-anti-sigma factor
LDGAVPAEFRIEVEPERDVARVRPMGEVDISTVDDVRATIEELRAAGFKRLILDLRHATFLDSCGLRLALDVTSSSAADGFEFAIVPGPPGVQRVFEVAGLSSHLPFIDA